MTRVHSSCHLKATGSRRTCGASKWKHDYKLKPRDDTLHTATVGSNFNWLPSIIIPRHRTPYPHKRCSHLNRGPFTRSGIVLSLILAALFPLCFIDIHSGAVWCLSTHPFGQHDERANLTDFGYRLSNLNHSTPQAASNFLLSTKDDIEQQSSMPANLKQFSNLNVDLVFEDSVDVETSHYNDTDYYDTDPSETITRGDSDGTISHGRGSVLRAPLLPSDNLPNSQLNIRISHGHGAVSQLERTPYIPPNEVTDQHRHSYNPDHNSQYNRLAGHIHEFNSHAAAYPWLNNLNSTEKSANLDEHAHTRNALANMFNRYSNKNQPNGRTLIVNQTEHSYQPNVNPTNPSLPNQFQKEFLSQPADNQWSPPSTPPDQNIYTKIENDHILRPFFRKESRHSPLRTSRLPLAASQNKPKDDSKWRLPVIELKRLTPNSIKPFVEKSRALFNKRMPLLSNEEGFMLTMPNSSLRKKDIIEKRMDDVEPFQPNNRFRRRFGELPRDSNENNIANMMTHKTNLAFNDGLFRMGYLHDDLGMNDLELDDMQAHRLPMQPSHPNRKDPKLRKPHMPKQNLKPLFDGKPPNAPLSQIMPLFFDKFLSEFSNANPPRLSNEGFSLPPLHSPDKGNFHHQDQTHARIPSSSTHARSINHIDADNGGDLDSPNPVERRLVSGNHNPKHKPDIAPPIFSNEILPINKEFESEFDSWPKIFRFTDGRINLHEFEREKKRSRVKFSHKTSKSHALFNIKRDSFLILHGGTFSQ